MAVFPGEWFWNDWWRDRTGKASKIDLPESGGFVLQIHNANGILSHVFCPYVGVWANAIGQATARAIAASRNDPVRIVADLSSVRYESQPVPRD